MAHTVIAAAAQGVRWRQWIGPVALFLAGLALYSINLDKPPRFDELYHVLGARGYLEHGEPRIAEGVYERARYFTALIALLFSVLGESLVVARLPAVVCGSLLVSLLFVWVRSVAGQPAAWFAAIALLLSPFLTHVAQDVRFYAPFALLFWLAAMAVYAAGTAERPSAARLALLTLAAAVCLGAAWHLQRLTLIGAVGLGLWLAIQVGLPRLRLALSGHARVAMALAVATVALLALAALWFPRELWHSYRFTPLFDAGTRNQFWFYHQWLNFYYPTLWPLFPLAALAALALRARPAVFCLCVFVTGFLLISFGGPKAMLYTTFVLPFLFVLWGMAFAYACRGIRGFVLEVTDSALRGVGIPPWPAIRTALIIATLGFVLLANTALIRTATMLAGIAVPPEVPATRWWEAAELLAPSLGRDPVVITSSELDALYYLGDYDVTLSKTRLSDRPEGAAEFERDRRTGRPIVSTPESVDRIITCFPEGLILVDSYRWRDSAHVDDATADLIVRRTEPIALPSRMRILAFHWADGETRTSGACGDLMQLMRRNQRS
jgi:Dolichyl-phosphate-mannose-protein mannosyltransferase